METYKCFIGRLEEINSRMGSTGTKLTIALVRSPLGDNTEFIGYSYKFNNEIILLKCFAIRYFQFYGTYNIISMHLNIL